MSEKYLIPESYAAPVAAAHIGCTTAEAQAMIDSGEIDPASLSSVFKAAQRWRTEAARHQRPEEPSRLAWKIARGAVCGFSPRAHPDVQMYASLRLPDFTTFRTEGPTGSDAVRALALELDRWAAS